MTKDDAKKIGVFGASAIVAGNMMGSGIALLPSNLAKIGSVSIIAWGIVGFGAGQVPQGATVSSATLTLTLYDPSTTPPGVA